jgi:flagellar biosynthetic protein FlhB
MASQQNGERTERPTAKRVRDARDHGNIPRSRDLTSAMSLAGVTLGLSWFGVQIVTLVATRLATGLSSLGDHARDGLDAGGIANLLASDAALLAHVVGPPALVGAAVGVLGGMAQSGIGFRMKALEVDWGRLSPGNGLERLKPMQALPELLKSLVMMTVVGVVGVLFVRSCLLQSVSLMGMAPIASAAFGWSQFWTLLWRASLTLLVFGAADYVYQRWRWFENMKMTKQEVKDEHRLNEGNPEIKARVRRVQREMTRARMLKAVKTATVVITNPTHFAVALEYRRGTMAAPVVVAKGQDHMAARIRAIAREHGVPIVENVTLARALYKVADIGDMIPADLFGAVAEVLAYLVRLKQLTL